MFLVVLLKMMSQNLRGEMSVDMAGSKLCLSNSRFIQVIAKSLSVSCKEVRAAAVAEEEEEEEEDLFQLTV